MFDHHRALMLQSPSRRLGLIDEDDEDIRLFHELMDSEWVVLEAPVGQEIIWNGFRLIVLPGENVVPMPFWVIWQQTQVDNKEAERNLARDIRASMEASVRRRPLKTRREYVLRPYNDESVKLFGPDTTRLLEGSDLEE